MTEYKFCFNCTNQYPQNSDEDNAEYCKINNRPCSDERSNQPGNCSFIANFYSTERRLPRETR